MTKFKELHQQNTPLLIANVWDVVSAKTAEKLNFQAIGTSSSAIAKGLGYEDGEQISFSEVEFIVKRIKASTKLPLTVDLEGGYSQSETIIAEYVKKLAHYGVVGCNIEDSKVNKVRTLQDAQPFAEIVSKVKQQLQKDNINMFFNVRVDTFITNHSNRLEETKKRIQLYQQAGADGIFVPWIEDTKDILEVVACTHLPINVLCMPNLPNFDTLKEIGVKRISMGKFAFDKMYDYFEQLLYTVTSEKSCSPLFKPVS